jgi:hypothetical protein
VFAGVRHAPLCLTAGLGNSGNPGLRMWRRAVRRYQLQAELMYADPDYADHVAHTVNKWLAVTQFVAYNISVILIFTINTALYG